MELASRRNGVSSSSRESLLALILAVFFGRRCVAAPRFSCSFTGIGVPAHRAVALAVLALGACGTDAASDQAFLWRIGQGATPTYLLGTVHLGVLAEDLPSSVWQAFDASSTFVAESDPDVEVSQEELERLTALPDGVVLSDLFDPVIWSRLQQVFAELPEETLEHFHPWAVQIALQQALIPPQEAMDESLTARARADGKAVAFLETIGDVGEVFAGIPLQDSADAVTALLLDPSGYVAAVNALIDLYRRGDVAQMQRAMWGEAGDTVEGSAQDDVILRQRNQAWLSAVEQYARAGATFVAVGLAHLIGPDNLLGMLADKGLFAERVTRADQVTVARQALQTSWGESRTRFRLDSQLVTLGHAYR